MEGTRAAQVGDMRASRSWSLLLALGLLAPGCIGELADRQAGPSGAPPRTPPGTPPIATPTTPAPATLRRLSAAQYTETVRALFGDDLTLAVELEPDTALNGFVAIGSSRATVSPRAAELYEQAALDLADRALLDAPRRASLVPCSPSGGVDAACARTFVASLGRRAWRRPLEAEEVERYATIADESARVLGDFYAGLSMATAGLLQSPHFLFRVESGELLPDGRRRYTGWEMASRLSYALWNGPPDEELLRAAEAGELTTDEGLRTQALRLAHDDRCGATVRDFFAELLRLEGLARLPQDPAIFPQMSPTIGAAMRESTLRGVEAHLMTRGLDYRSLFTSRDVFVDAELARLYGVAEPAAGEWAEVTLPSGGARAGLLGHGSVLAVTGHSHASSPTLRGKFVREALLCQSIPPPPMDVGELPEPSPELPTMRERLAAHRENPACASCHTFMDPIGLGLENFDAIGAYRETENGARIDPTGELDEIAFDDARGLGEALASHPRLTGCLVRNLYRYTTGHVETSGEEPTLAALTTTFDADSSVRELLVELVSSDGFRYAGEPR